MPVTQDTQSGQTLHMTVHTPIVTLLDDAAFFSFMLALFNMNIAGMGAPIRLFIPEEPTMRYYSYANQVIRHGLLFGSFAEIRRMLEMAGLNTNASHYLEHLRQMLLP